MDYTHIFALLGGLGLFLYGMEMMGKGLESTAGSRLKALLERLTTNRFAGVVVGLVVTSIIQSSSATTVMVVGFVNAGLMNLSQAFGVMLGANIGTTVTGQIIAFNISDWAPLFAILGILPMLFAKKRKAKSLGTIMAGFGILFIGLNMMGDAMVPLRGEAWFISAMTSFQNPILGVLAGAVFTGIIQSSSASVGILQTLAAQGLVSLDAGLYLVLGCNIGTCATALIASIGTNTNARRTAYLHLFNKIVGAAVFTLVLYVLPVTQWVSLISPADPRSQIANFHTIFNILNTVMLFPFGKLMVSLVTHLAKDRQQDSREERRLLYLNDLILETPPIAMSQLQEEIKRMAELAVENYDNGVSAFLKSSDDLAQSVMEGRSLVDYLGREVTAYMVKIQAHEGLDRREKERLFKLHDVVMSIERISGHAENLAEFAQLRIESQVHFTEDALSELTVMCRRVRDALSSGLSSLLKEEAPSDDWEDVEEIEAEVDAMFTVMRQNHIERLNQERCTPVAGMLFTDMGADLERISDYAVKVSQLTV